MAEFYHFRCFTESIEQDELITFLKENTNVLLAVFETSYGSHRPHVHVTLQFPKSVNAFRDKLRQKFPTIFGNKSYSISKVRDYESNLKYCCKGTASDYPDVLYTTIPDDMVKQYYNEYWVVQKSVLKAKAKSKEVNMGCQNDSSLPEVKQPKVRTLTWSEKLHKTIVADYPGLCQGFVQYHSGLTVDYDMLHEALTGVILEHLGKHAKNLDEFILIRLYNAQLNSIIQNCGDEKCKTNFKKELSQKIKGKTM